MCQHRHRTRSSPAGDSADRHQPFTRRPVRLPLRCPTHQPGPRFGAQPLTLTASGDSVTNLAKRAGWVHGKVAMRGSIGAEPDPERWLSSCPRTAFAARPGACSMPRFAWQRYPRRPCAASAAPRRPG
ncbi:protein of unknown function [Micropruina glycogenica]|uniref:Uncharacterized protein n=1 Tax=Micropruina glycogenica TaxID=75385 RepID=A0A2N9JF91_9ACTN|nr:protein of unknown function [Micropruina glycogenica]